MDGFWDKVEIPADVISGCWSWGGSIDHQGYGRFFRGKEEIGTQLAHRISFALVNGHLKRSAMVCHKCHNRRCVNPAHIYAGTQKQNMRDMVDAKRTTAKLTAEQVLAARADRHAGVLRIKSRARELGVAVSTLRNAVLGETWTHLPRAGVGSNRVNDGLIAQMMRNVVVDGETSKRVSGLLRCLKGALPIAISKLEHASSDKERRALIDLKLVLSRL